MKRVGVREFEDHAATYLSSNEALTIERDGVPLGYYIPSRAGRRESYLKSLKALEETVERILAETGMTEDELADLFDLNKPLPEHPKPRLEPVAAGEHAPGR